MFAQLNPHSSDFGDICAPYPPFLHQLIMSVVVCVARKLCPCPSYSRRRDRVNLGLLRSLYKGRGDTVLLSVVTELVRCLTQTHKVAVTPALPLPRLPVPLCQASWAALLALARHPKVCVKLSAMFRVSAAPWPHPDLGPRVRALLQAYGSGRLMWGSDWPWVTVGGGPWQWGRHPPEPWPTAMAVDYGAAARTLVDMGVPGLGEEEVQDVMWRTACGLFGFRTGAEGEAHGGAAAG